MGRARVDFLAGPNISEDRYRAEDVTFMQTLADIQGVRPDYPHDFAAVPHENSI